MEYRPESLPAALDDETLTAHRPAVRALLVRRMEALNAVAEDELESGKDRVRWAELQIRIADRIAKWYRLDVPAGGDEVEADAGEEQERIRLSVTLQMDQLAEREG